MNSNRSLLNAHRSWGVAAAIAASLGCTPSLAQQSSPEPESSAATLGLEEIVVTAQKREEKLSRVPISISALSEAHLEQIGAKDLAGFAREIPGLSVQAATNGGAPSIVIRGISSAAGDATVGVYIDDTPVQAVKSSFSGDPTPKLFDIERVEVLRGPQGTLYGASSEGGTVRFITPKPSLTDFTARARTEFSSTEDGEPSYEIGAAAGGPVAEQLGLRGSVYYRTDGGYIDRVSRVDGGVTEKDANSSESLAARLAANYAPSDSLEILPSIYYQRIRNDHLPLTYSTSRPLQVADTVATPGEDWFVLPGLTINYDFGAARFTSVSSYFERRNDQQFDYSTITTDLLFGSAILPGFENYHSVSNTRTTQKNFTQELRLSSPNDAGPFGYTAGVFYQHAQTGFRQQVAEPELNGLVQTLFGAPLEGVLGIGLLPGGLSYFQTSATTVEQIAAFGEASYEFTSQLKLTVGARVAQVDVESEFSADGLYNGGPTAPELLGVQKASETPINPKLTLSYQITDDDLVYATGSRGFRAGGPNTPVPVGRCGADLTAQGTSAAQLRSFDSDSVWNYELGAKTALLDGRLALNGSVFYIDWSDIQQALALPTCGFGYVANLGNATSKGFDLAIQYQLIEGLTLAVAAGYTDATLDEDIFAGANPITGARALIARKGDSTLLTPEWTGNVALNYQLELANGVRGYARADLQRSSTFYRTTSAGTTSYDPELYRGPAYSFGTLRVGMIRDGLNVSVFVDNISNEQPVLFASYAQNPSSRMFQQQTTLRPRTIGISAAYDF
jgi:iron complex outermembrane recepter protein